VPGDGPPVSGEFLVEVYVLGEFVIVANASGVFTVVIRTRYLWGGAARPGKGGMAILAPRRDLPRRSP